MKESARFTQIKRMLSNNDKLRFHIMRSQKGLFKEMLQDNKPLHNQETQKKTLLLIKILKKKAPI